MSSTTGLSLKVYLEGIACVKLREAARIRHMVPSVLAQSILKHVLEDNLVEAVLDDIEEI